MYNFYCSKRQMKFGLRAFIKYLKLSHIKKIRFFIIKIAGPRPLIKVLVKSLKRLNYKSKFIILNSFKIFNGCRFKKLRRKKHLKFKMLR